MDVKIFSYKKVSWSRKSLCLWKTYLVVEKFFLVENFPNLGEIFPCGKVSSSWKTSLIIKKSLLVENFLDHGKVSASGKLFWWWENIWFWKTFLIVEKSVHVENFLDQVFWKWSGEEYLGLLLQTRRALQQKLMAFNCIPLLQGVPC